MQIIPKTIIKIEAYVFKSLQKNLESKKKYAPLTLLGIKSISKPLIVEARKVVSSDMDTTLLKQITFPQSC